MDCIANNSYDVLARVLNIASKGVRISKPYERISAVGFV